MAPARAGRKPQRMTEYPRPFIAVHQPNYAPWIGYFVKMAVADTFVLLDDVQFSKGSWTNRAKAMGPNGPAFLTVPLAKPGFLPIREIRISDPAWREAHVRKLRDWYRETEGLPLAASAVEAAAGDCLAEANERGIESLCGILGIRPSVVRSSALGIDAADPVGRLVQICAKLGAGTYISGQGASKYNDTAAFKTAGIELAYLRFDHPEYPQGRGEFTRGLSVLDLVACCGSSSRDVFERTKATAVLEAPPTTP